MYISRKTTIKTYTGNLILCILSRHDFPLVVLQTTLCKIALFCTWLVCVLYIVYRKKVQLHYLPEFLQQKLCVTVKLGIKFSFLGPMFWATLLWVQFTKSHLLLFVHR